MRLIDADLLYQQIKEKKLYSGMVKAMLLDTIQDQPTAGDWISVKDRLPDDGLIGKLVYDIDNGIRVCGKLATITMSNGEKVFTMDAELTDFLLVGGFNYAPIDSITHITHWMPLPEPPKEDETE